MFIYHFNRMIRSRILWIIFAVVIAFAFLSVDSCYRNPGGRSGAERNPNEAGSVAGESVSYDEYDFTRRMLSSTIANLEPAATETQIWAHIAALRTARDLGITASRRELVDRIVNTPDFQIAGAFDRGRYEAVVSSIGLSVPSFERMQANYIVLFKLMSVVTAGATASPMSIDDELAQYTDTFSLRYATVKNTHANEEIEVTDDDIAGYYERNKANFDLPDRVQVRFATLSATNFTDAVVLEDADADAQDIYDTDPSRFTRRGTNGVEQLSFEEAKPQIIEDLTLAEAVHVATTNLSAFMESLGDADADQFEARAKMRGLTVRDSALFAYDTQYIPGVESAALDEFRSEAADLDVSRADSLYAIARGNRNVYLMRIVTNDLAHTQPLEVVTNTIRPLALAEKRIELFDADAKAALDSIKAKMEGAGNFSEAFATACGELSLALSSNVTFRIADNNVDDLEHAREIIPAALRMKAGDISDPVKINGGALILCLDSRTRDDNPDSSFEVASTRERIASQRAQTADSLFFAEWLLQNLKEKGFTSRVLEGLEAAGPATDDDEEE